MLQLPALLLALAPLQDPTSIEQSVTVQDPSGSQDPTARDPEQERPQHRILFCRGGAVIRGLTRPLGADGAWEVRRNGKWTPVPAGLVLSTEMEKDTEKEYARQLKDVRKLAEDKRPEALAKAAGWALEHGLLKEGVKGLDDLLTEHVDLQAARDAMCANAKRFPVPPLDTDKSGKELIASLGDLFAWGSNMGPALQELTMVEMAKVRDREALLEGLTGELGARDSSRRSMASLSLRRLFPGKSPRALILHATLDPDRDVRASSARTLGAAHDSGVIVPLVRTLDSTHPTLRERSAEALGNMAYPAAVEPLVRRLQAAAQPGAAAAAGGSRPPHSNIYVGTQMAYLQDFDVEVAMGSSIADPIVNVLTSGSVLDVGVLSVVQVHFARETRAIRGALGKLTGADPGNTNRAWLRWWEKNSEDWRASRFLDSAASGKGSTPTSADGR